MDQGRIGSFIRELRKSHGLTQKELAERVFVTDRAVSKWERGLSSPDISLLKPLSDALGVSVSELLQGEREAKSTVVLDEEKLESVLEYSKRKLKEKLHIFRKKYLGITAAVACLLLISIVVCLWRSGVFFLIERGDSPDGSYSVAVYSRDFRYPDFFSPSSNEFYLSVKDRRSGTMSHMTCKNAGPIELWWSPDSQKLVVLSGDSNAVIDFTNGVSFDYHASLSDAAVLLELEDINYAEPDIHYRLLQWGEDSESLLLYYYYIGRSSKPHDGYFWYNCVTGEMSGKFEMNSGIFPSADAEVPLTKMLHDDTAKKILENFDPNDCDEILYRSWSGGSRVSVTDTQTMQQIADAIRGMTVVSHTAVSKPVTEHISDLIFVMKDDTSYLKSQEKKEGHIIFLDSGFFECDDPESEVIGDTVWLFANGYKALEEILILNSD